MAQALSYRTILSAGCLAGLLASGAAGSASAAPAPLSATEMVAQPMSRGSSVRVVGDGACKVFVAVTSGRQQVWEYDGATGGLDPTPTFADNTNPVGGIGIVVKKNPGGSAVRMALDPNGSAALNPPDGDGVYNLVINVPPPARGASECANSATGARLVLTLQKTGTSFVVLKAEHAVNTKGTGTTRTGRVRPPG